jgi:glycerophosphoryl diester phosphodiesterase
MTANAKFTRSIRPLCRGSLLVFLAALLAGCSTMRSPEIIAHRGASHDAPENTLAAFRLALEQGADALELDIRQTRDGRVVVIHDADTKRIGARDRKVGEQTFAELQSLDAGSWKDPRWTGERFPSLDDALALVPAGKRVFVEIKCGPEVVPELERIVAASRLPAEQVVFIAFSLNVARAAKTKFPRHEVFWIYDWKKDKDTGATFSPDELIARAREAGVDGLDVNHQGPVDAAFVKRVKAAGLKLCVWTVDDPEAARRLADAGVEGLTTNRPGWLREQLRQR